MGIKRSKYREDMNTAQREIVEDAIADAGGVIVDATRKLGITRSYMYRLIEKHGLS